MQPVFVPSCCSAEQKKNEKTNRSIGIVAEYCCYSRCAGSVLGLPTCC